VANRAGEQQSYRDLRERAKRRERRRDLQLERIVGLQRERHLHSVQRVSGAVAAAIAA
jgi:hypothetical protein